MNEDTPGAPVGTNEKRSSVRRSDLALITMICGVHLIMTIVAIILVMSNGEDKVRQMVKAELRAANGVDEQVAGLHVELNAMHDRNAAISAEKEKAFQAFAVAQGMLHEEHKQSRNLASLLQETGKRLRTSGSADALEYLDAAVNRWIEIQDRNKKPEEKPDNPIEKVIEKLLPAQANNAASHDKQPRSSH